MYLCRCANRWRLLQRLRFDLNRHRAAILALGAAIAAVPIGHLHAREPGLPAYNADITQTSISGISSGAFMAVQFGVAWSSIIKGVGAIAGGPYGCSEGSASAALSSCMGGQPAPEVQTLIKRADHWAKNGAIDDTANLAAQKIYLFNGYNDAVVMRPVSNALHTFYAHYLGPNHLSNLFYQTAIGAGHSQVTLAYGSDCAANGGEFINKCRYDQAGVILQHIYGMLSPRNDASLTGRLVSFSQAEFTAPDQPVDNSLADKGFAYVPAPCEAQEPCRVHVALHGCLQSYGNVGSDFVRYAGYNEWADTNHIIVLYPQTKDRDVVNPQACWDWWGYLDTDPTQTPAYLLKSGKQIRAIKAMLDRLTSAAVSSARTPESEPVTPPTVMAPDSSDTAIDVVWSSVHGATSYEVFRSDPSEPAFHQIATVSGLSLGDAGLQPASLYHYEVRAQLATGPGPFSMAMSKATLSKVPTCNEPGSCAVR